MAAAWVVCSCAEKALEDQPSVLNHVSIGVKAVDMTDISAETKSDIDISGGFVNFSWSSTDVVGMYPNVGAQAFFEMQDHVGEAVAEFDGGGWALKSASQYAVYFPYDYGHSNKSSLPFDYRGQTQHGRNSFSHLADWQFLAQGMKQPENGACAYSMERIEAIVLFQLQFPDIVNCDKLTFRLADGHKVVISTRLDISGADYVISSDGEANQFTLDLEGVAPLSTGETLYFYAMMPPQDLSGRTAIVSVHTTDGDNYYAAFDGKNMLANHAYQYAATLTNDYASFMEKYGLEDGFWD